MNPIDFESANTNLTGPVNVGDMPAYKGQGMIISRWKASWRERLSILFFGNVWVAVVGERQPPIAIAGARAAYFVHPEVEGAQGGGDG